MQKAEQKLRHEISEEIGRLRQKLQQLVKDKDENLLDPKVIWLSRKIDELIVQDHKDFGKPD